MYQGMYVQSAHSAENRSTGMVASPARGQLSRGNNLSSCPVRDREFGLA